MILRFQIDGPVQPEIHNRGGADYTGNFGYIERPAAVREILRRIPILIDRRTIRKVLRTVAIDVVTPYAATAVTVVLGSPGFPAASKVPGDCEFFSCSAERPEAVTQAS